MTIKITRKHGALCVSIHIQTSRQWRCVQKVPERDCQKEPTVEGLEDRDTRATHYAASASGWQGVTPATPRVLAGGNAPGGSAGVGVLVCCSLIGQRE